MRTRVAALSARLARLPLTVRVPLAVAALLVGVSVVVSERVLTRLIDTQTRHLSELGNAYLDGVSSSLIPAVLRGDVWEAFDTLDRAKSQYGGLHPVQTVVTDKNGLVLAASDPRGLRPGERLPDAFARRFPGGDGIAAQPGAARAYLHRDLVYQGRSIGDIYAILDISALMAERRHVLATLIWTNGAMTLVMAALGYLAMRRMVRPMRLLAEHLGDAGGPEPPRPIPAHLIAGDPETTRLLRAYNRLVAAEAERTALIRQLAEEERLASLGRLASGMAHEINNPLGGLMNALDTLKHHGHRPEVRASTLTLLERGLDHIRGVVRATLVSYRGRDTERSLTRADLDDLTVLVGPRLRQRGVLLTTDFDLPAQLPLPAGPIRQILINLALNAAAAAAEGGRIAVTARLCGKTVSFAIEDDGPGLPDDARAVLTGAGPVSAARTPPGPHLGLWLVRRLAEEAGARLVVDRSRLGGARIALTLALPEGPGTENLSHVA